MFKTAVEMEKAANFDLELIVSINDDMKEFKEFPDVVSIIGNLCDNAIEYLSKNDVTDKRIILEILHNNSGMYKISCKNMTTGSVLSDNPELKTSKDDFENHGLGINIIRANAEKHLGDFEYFEENGYITFTVLLNEWKN